VDGDEVEAGDGGEGKGADEGGGEREGSRRRARRDALSSLFRDGMVPSDTSAEVSESRLRDDVSNPVVAGAVDEEVNGKGGSFSSRSKKEKVVEVSADVDSAKMKLPRFLAGQLDGRFEDEGEEDVIVDVAEVCWRR